MTERAIIEAAARLRTDGEPHLVATVVRVHGSAYRRAGARMLLTRDRWIAGSVSGGCLEGDITRKAWWRTAGGSPVVVTYDSRIPDDGDLDDVRAAFGVGCDGVVEVLLERAGLPERLCPLAFSEDCLRAQRRGAIATVIHSDVATVAVGARLALAHGEQLIDDVVEGAPAGRLRDAVAEHLAAAIECGATTNRTYPVPGGMVDVLIEAVVPPPRLFVFGTGHDAMPVVAMARALGWDTVVCTARPSELARQRFVRADELLIGSPEEIATHVDAPDRAFAVVMNHNLDADRATLGMLLGTRVRYVGVLGPRARTNRLLADLGRAGDTRLHAPVGLDVGAETPQEVALAIVAEIQAVLAHASGVHLSERVGPIHAPAVCA